MVCMLKPPQICHLWVAGVCYCDKLNAALSLLQHSRSVVQHIHFAHWFHQFSLNFNLRFCLQTPLPLHPVSSHRASNPVPCKIFDDLQASVFRMATSSLRHGMTITGALLLVTGTLCFAWWSDGEMGATPSNDANVVLHGEAEPVTSSSSSSSNAVLRSISFFCCGIGGLLLLFGLLWSANAGIVSRRYQYHFSRDLHYSTVEPLEKQTCRLARVHDTWWWWIDAYCSAGRLSGLTHFSSSGQVVWLNSCNREWGLCSCLKKQVRLQSYAYIPGSKPNWTQWNLGRHTRSYVSAISINCESHTLLTPR